MIYMTERADKTSRERKGEDGKRQIRPRQDGRGKERTRGDWEGSDRKRKETTRGGDRREQGMRERGTVGRRHRNEPERKNRREKIGLAREKILRSS